MIETRPVVLANQIRLLRSHHRGTFLVVEGRDDRLFCDGRLDLGECKIVVAEGKDRVLEVVQTLDQSGFPGVVGMVDADFDRLGGVMARGPNIVLTDTHDLESLLVKSSALDSVLVELGAPVKIARLARGVRDLLIEGATLIGRLRLLSGREGMNLRFDGLRFARFTDPTTLFVDLRGLIEDVKSRSQQAQWDTAILTEQIEGMAAAGLDPWQLCAGPDLIALLSFGLRSAIGTNSAAVVSVEQLRRALRLAYRRDEFIGSQIERSFVAWEERNRPYRLL